MVLDFQPVIDGDFALADLDLNVEDVPIPEGYRLLIDPKKPIDRTDSGIVLTDETVRAQKYTRYYGRVLRVGPTAYTHPKFEGHRWCSVGDWVVFNPHDGLSIKLRIPLKAEALRRFEEEQAGLRAQRDELQDRLQYATREEKPAVKHELDTVLDALARSYDGDGSVDWSLLVLNDEDISARITNPRHLVTFF